MDILLRLDTGNEPPRFAPKFSINNFFWGGGGAAHLGTSQENSERWGQWEGNT